LSHTTSNAAKQIIDIFDDLPFLVTAPPQFDDINFAATIPSGRSTQTSTA
jgi:hypothetical protein